MHKLFWIKYSIINSLWSEQGITVIEFQQIYSSSWIRMTARINLFMWSTTIDRNDFIDLRLAWISRLCWSSRASWLNISTVFICDYTLSFLKFILVLIRLTYMNSNLNKLIILKRQRKSYLIGLGNAPFKIDAKRNVIIVGGKFPKQARPFFMCWNTNCNGFTMSNFNDTLGAFWTNLHN